MRLFCQITIVILFVSNIVSLLYVDCNGRKAKSPGGFIEVIATLIAATIGICLLLGAGLFSDIFR